MAEAEAARFELPPYPYDRLDPLKEIASAVPGGIIDLSIGTPYDAPPDVALEAFARADGLRGYPASIGQPALREAASRWLHTRLGVDVDPSLIGAAVGTKEFVAGVPSWLRLRDPERDTVLYPEISYPSYAMGASLAGCRSVPVALDASGSLDVSSIDDADAGRALCLWVNTPGNPAGGLDDLDDCAAWGRDHGVPVFSDECYVEFTWDGPPRTILSTGTDGVVAVHSLSKRSNFAGGRCGFYAGDAEIVKFLTEVRKHAGLMVPGPVQAAAIAAFDDADHVVVQRKRYHERLVAAQEMLAAAGVPCDLPRGAFYLWAEAPDGDAWALTRRLAEVGVLVSPGEFYGEAGRHHVRVAVVQTLERIQEATARLRAA